MRVGVIVPSIKLFQSSFLEARSNNQIEARPKCRGQCQVCPCRTPEDQEPCRIERVAHVA